MSPWTTCNAGCRSGNLTGSRTKAVTAWLRSSACSTSCRPVPPVAPNMKTRMIDAPGGRGRLDRLLAREETVEPGDHVLEVRGVAAVDLRPPPAVVADVAESPPDLDPVDVALAQVLPVEAAVGAVELEVLQVHLDDTRTEGADPVLRVAVEHD